MHGVVLGMAAKDVTPPFSAASVALAMVSLSSRPGSRRCTCISTSPGNITHPRASIVCPAFVLIALEMLLILPFSISISQALSALLSGSIIRPFFINILIVRALPVILKTGPPCESLCRLLPVLISLNSFHPRPRLISLCRG